RLRADFEREADTLVERVLKAGVCDAVADIAEAYSVSVFPPAVGLKEIDQRKLVDYGAMVFNALGPDNAIRRSAMKKAAEIVPWVAAQCQRENLRTGGFGAEIYAAAESGDLTAQEAGMLVRSLLSAGVDTTVTAIGSAIWALASNPDQFQRLRANPK